jgi:hypothetical protein
LLLFVLAALPVQGAVHAQGTPKIDVDSVYTLNRYGFAIINETVTLINNGTSGVQVPSLTFGFGNLSSDVAQTNLTAGFTLASASAGGPFTVTGSQSIPAGGNLTYSLSALLNGVVSTNENGTLQVLTLSSPSIGSMVSRLVNLVQMPASTSFSSSPLDLTASVTGTNNTYSSTESDLAPQSATTSLRQIASSSTEDFNPLHVFQAQRTISAAANGIPEVTDEIEFENLGTIPLAQLYISPLTSLSTEVTIVTATSNEPVLLNPFRTSISGGAVNLAQFVVGYPSDGVQAGANFTLTIEYPLGSSYYTVSGGQVSVHVPETPPVSAFIDSYSIGITLSHGAKPVQSGPVDLTSVTPWQTGKTTFAYGLSAGWFLDAGIPLASVVFVLLLVGLFAARSSMTPAEESEKEEEEETSTETASAMIQAFDEKTTLINGIWSEIASKDPNELDKAYFDELRGRLDAFRNRALQRLNEVKQKSASQKFTDVVNQIHATEREVDRAAKDKLNLCQQYYLSQMRKEVYDRLLPQYTKRLERALNQLSDELHTVQREAKLL